MGYFLGAAELNTCISRKNEIWKAVYEKIPLIYKISDLLNTP